MWRTLWHWRARKAAGRAGEQLGMRPLQRASAAHTRRGQEQSCKLGMHPAAASVAAGRGGQNVSASTDAPPLPTLDVRSHPRTRHGPIFGLRPRAEDPSADARPTSSRAEQAGGGSAAAPAGSFTSVTIHPLSTLSSGPPPGWQIAHMPPRFRPCLMLASRGATISRARQSRVPVGSAATVLTIVCVASV